MRRSAAICKMLSQGCDGVLQFARHFRKDATKGHNLQDTFTRMRRSAAICKTLSQGCDGVLQYVGHFREEMKKAVRKNP